MKALRSPLKTGLICGVLFLLLFLGFSVLGDNGLLDVIRKKDRLHAIEAKNQKIERQNQDLYRRVRRLKNDPRYLEYVIRQQLSVVGPEQIVFKFESSD
ncbi:MAG: septum formation initiator family protein [Desulfosalsimonadaceae bacterium]